MMQYGKMSCLSGHLAVVAAPVGWRWHRVFEVGVPRLNLARSWRNPGVGVRPLRRLGSGPGIGCGFPNSFRFRVPAAFHQEVEGNVQKPDSFPPIVKLYPDDPSAPKSEEDGSPVAGLKAAAQGETEQQEHEKNRSFPPIVRFYPDEKNESQSVENGNSDVEPAWKAAETEKEQQGQERSGLLPPVVRFYPDESSQSNSVGDGSEDIPPRWKIVQAERERQEQEKRANELTRRRNQKRQRELAQRQRDAELMRERELGGSSGDGSQGTQIGGFPSFQSSTPRPSSFAPPISTFRSVTPLWPALSNDDMSSKPKNEENQGETAGTPATSAPASGSDSSEAVPGEPPAPTKFSWSFPSPFAGLDGENVPKWKIAQAEREQQERQKRARELARRRIERKQRENAQRQKEIAEMREREIANGTAFDPWSFGTLKPAANPLLAGSTDASQSETTGSVLGSEATNKDAEGSTLPPPAVVPTPSITSTWTFPMLRSSSDPPPTLPDGSPDIVAIRKIAIAEREQQERQKRARELTRRKVERRQREVAEKQRQLAEYRAKDLAEGNSGGWSFGNLPPSAYAIGPSTEKSPPPPAAANTPASSPLSTFPPPPAAGEAPASSPWSTLPPPPAATNTPANSPWSTLPPPPAAANTTASSPWSTLPPPPAAATTPASSPWSTLPPPPAAATTPASSPWSTLPPPPAAASTPASSPWSTLPPPPAAASTPASSPWSTLPPPPATAYTPASSPTLGSPTEAGLDDEEFYEHVLLERKQSEARDSGLGGETRAYPSSASPLSGYTSAGNVSGWDQRQMEPQVPMSSSFGDSPQWPTANNARDSYSVTPYPDVSNSFPATVGDGFPDIVPRRRMTPAEREQEEREKRAKELARRRIERKQRELAQKQKEYAEERARNLAENPEGASYYGGYGAAANSPLAGYPPPVGAPFEASGADDGESGSQFIRQNATDPGY